MSRAKFDMSGYDPKAMRKKKDETAVRNVLVKQEEDCEIFTSDLSKEAPHFGNIEVLNQKLGREQQKDVLEKMYDVDYQEE